MLKKVRFYLILVTVFAVSILVESCNDEPTMMGSTLLYDTIAIYPISTGTNPLITEMSSYRFDFNVRDRKVFHVGIFKDVKALSILQFEEPLRNTDTLDFLLNYTESQIISCKLKINVNRYALGDTMNSNSLSFKAFKVTTNWLKDSLEKKDYNEVIPYFELSKAIAEFNGTITQKDTMDVISMDFSKELLLDWFKTWQKNRLDSNSTDITWGIALIPDDNSKVVRSFVGANYSSGSEPYLEVIYDNQEGVRDTLIIEEGTDKSFYSIEDYTPNELVVQGGVSTRGMIKFDISKIPQISAIHQAQMELTLNKEKCYYGNYDLDSTIYAELPSYDSNYYKEDFIRTYYAERVLDKFYFTSITSAIETWNRRDNKGLIVLHPEGDQNEYRELDKLVFYGLDAPDSTKLPVLKIIYSKRPDFK